MGDAIGRTLVRLLVTRRHLLEWVPAAQATIGPRLDLLAFYRRMVGAVIIGVAGLGFALLAGQESAGQLAPGRCVRDTLDRIAGDRPLGEQVASGGGPADRVRR